MHWLSRHRLLILSLIAVFWTGLVGLAHFFPTAPFLSTVWRGERTFADVLRREGRKTMTHSDFAFLGIDQTSLSLKPEEEDWSNNRALQLMSENAYPWPREVWGLLLDRLFQAGARLVMFDIVFDKPKEGDDIFRAALDRYRDKVVIAANFDLSRVRQLGGITVNVPPAGSLIPPPQMQDDRVGCVIVFPDPLDNRIRSVSYRFTDPQLRGDPPSPNEVPYEALSTRALRKLGHVGDIPGDLEGISYALVRSTLIRRGRSGRFSIRSPGRQTIKMAPSSRTRSSSWVPHPKSRMTSSTHRLIQKRRGPFFICTRWPRQWITNFYGTLQFESVSFWF